jgi:hypothetical protein
MPVKKHEYHEGHKAGENFESLARVVLRAPKPEKSKKQPKSKPPKDKSSGSDES